MTEISDRAVTAVTVDGAFRVIVARTTETVRAAIAAQGVSGANARNLADVLTGTILVRLTMAPGLRVQGIVRGAGSRGTIVGDSHPDQTTRGLVQLPGDLEEVSLAKGAVMQMMRTMPRGDLHTGVVEVPDESVARALMGYFQASEQIECVARTLLRETDEGIEAAGYVVQLLPEVSRAPLAVMTERLAADYEDADAVIERTERDPVELLGAILEFMPHAVTQDQLLSFGCRCSSVRVLSSLATLSKDEIRSLIADGESLDITCDYCGKNYAIPLTALQGLLTSS